MNTMYADALILAYLVQRRATFAARQLLGLKPLLAKRDSPLSSQEALDALAAVGLDRSELLRWRLGMIASAWGMPQAAWAREMEDAAAARCRDLPDARPRPVPRVGAAEWSRPGFLARRVRRGQPFILSDFAATLARDERWTVRGFIERCRGERVLLTRRDGRTEMAPIADMLGGGSYLHNGEGLFKRIPELRRELNLDALCRLGAAGKLLTNELFLGRESTVTGLHVEAQQLYFFMICGHKRWTVVEPALSPLMGMRIEHGRIFVHSRVGSPSAPADSAPLYRVCPRHEAELAPGDVLYLPPFWWHGVENAEEDTLGITTRWSSGPETSRFLSMLWYLNLPLTKRYFEVLRGAVRSGDFGSPWQADGSTMLEEVAHGEGYIHWDGDRSARVADRG